MRAQQMKDGKLGACALAPCLCENSWEQHERRNQKLTRWQVVDIKLGWKVKDDGDDNDDDDEECVTAIMEVWSNREEVNRTR